MQGLVRAKLLTSKRGVHGGFMLTKGPHQLTIWEVIDAVEPLRRTHGLRRRAGTPKDGLDSLSQRLDQTIAMMEKSLRNTTVAELVTRSGREGKGKRLPETRTTRMLIKQSTATKLTKRKTRSKKKG
jgi:DNA-binding IscR family transcriptional regulator